MAEAVIRVVPTTSQQFYDKMLDLYKNRSHVNSIVVDEQTSSVHVNLDGMAHTFGHPDMVIPLKRSGIYEAHRLVAAINDAVAQKREPSRADSDALFAVLDLGR